MAHGVCPNLVRVSVGLEDLEVRTRTAQQWSLPALPACLPACLHCLFIYRRDIPIPLTHAQQLKHAFAVALDAAQQPPPPGVCPSGYFPPGLHSRSGDGPA